MSAVRKVDLDQVLFDELADPWIFFRNCGFAAGAALIGGAILDNWIRTVQGGQYDRMNAALYFIVQIVIIIIIMFILTRIYVTFMATLQATASGLIFSVLVFAVQTNLLTNATIITQFK